MMIFWVGFSLFSVVINEIVFFTATSHLCLLALHTYFCSSVFKWALIKPEICFLIEHLQGLLHMLLLFLEQQSVCLENQKFDGCCFPQRNTLDYFPLIKHVVVS